MNIRLLLFYIFLCLNFLLLYCYYHSVMYGTMMPVSAYMALAFVFGFIQIN